MAISIPNMQDLLEAGVHFGHQVRRGNPKMKSYIYGARDGIHIIDLAQSEEKLKQAAEYAYELGKKGSILLVIGTKKQAKDIVEDLAKSAETPYLTSHWVGGLLTNFDEIKKNLRKLTDLQIEQDKGELSRYTKKEQLLISRKLEKFGLELGGLSAMDKIPDALFIVDIVADGTAVKEALRMNVPMIGFSDTNANPLLLDFPIPSNDDGIKAIKIICETVLKAYQKGKEDGGVMTVQPKKEPAAKDAKKTDEIEVIPQVDAAIAEEAEVLEQEIEAATLEAAEGKEGKIE